MSVSNQTNINSVASSPASPQPQPSAGERRAHFVDETADESLQNVVPKVEGGWGKFLGWGRNLVYGERDKIQKEISHIASHSQGKELDVLVIESDLPTEHPDAYKQFPIKADIAKFRKYAETHSIDYCPIKNRNQYMAKMNERQKAGKFYDVIRVRGHGNSDHVELGEFTFENDIDSFALKKLAARVKDGGQVIFESCEVGKGEDNLAQAFSKYCPEATVYASAKIHDPVFGLSEDANGTPSFKGGLLGIFGDSTRIYKGGKLVSNKG